MSEKQNTCCKERPENTLSVDDFPSSKEDNFPSLLLPECHTEELKHKTKLSDEHQNTTLKYQIIKVMYLHLEIVYFIYSIISGNYEFA